VHWEAPAVAAAGEAVCAPVLQEVVAVAELEPLGSALSWASERSDA